MKVRFSSIAIRAGMIVALGLFTACSDQSSNINQLNQNEFTLRGMIASDRQQIDALRAELRRTQDELAEIRHGSAASAGAAAPADVNDRLAKLESEVNALQVALRGALTGGRSGNSRKSRYHNRFDDYGAASQHHGRSAAGSGHNRADHRERRASTDLAARPRQGNR